MCKQVQVTNFETKHSGRLMVIFEHINKSCLVILDEDELGEYVCTAHRIISKGPDMIDSGRWKIIAFDPDEDVLTVTKT